MSLRILCFRIFVLVALCLAMGATGAAPASQTAGATSIIQPNPSHAPSWSEPAHEIEAEGEHLSGKTACSTIQVADITQEYCENCDCLEPECYRDCTKCK